MKIKEGYDSGFTLQELLVGLNLAFLMVSFCMILFLAVVKLVSSWQNRMDVKASVNSIIDQISIDAERAERVLVHSDSLLELRTKRGDPILYHLSPSKVRRNALGMNRDRVFITGSFDPARCDSGGVRVRISGVSGDYQYEDVIIAQANPDWVTRFHREYGTDGF